MSQFLRVFLTIFSLIASGPAALAVLRSDRSLTTPTPLTDISILGIVGYFYNPQAQGSKVMNDYPSQHSGIVLQIQVEALLEKTD